MLIQNCFILNHANLFLIMHISKLYLQNKIIKILLIPLKLTQLFGSNHLKFNLMSISFSIFKLYLVVNRNSSMYYFSRIEMYVNWTFYDPKCQQY